MANVRKFTKDNVYNGKEIKMDEGMEADCGILDAIEESVDRAVSGGAGRIVLYDILLPRQYAEQNNANEKFKLIQADICRHQKRVDGSDATPRYIAVRDAMSESPVFKVAMFLPEETNYDREEFESNGSYITDGKLTDWKAYREHDLMALCEKHGVMVKETLPLDGTQEASEEAFYVASEMAMVKSKPRTRAERMLFRSRNS